jgi:hypothetical protein
VKRRWVIRVHLNAKLVSETSDMHLSQVIAFRNLTSGDSVPSLGIT